MPDLGPMEPPRPSCRGQQLTQAPEGTGPALMTPPPRGSLLPALHQHPFGTFSYHDDGGVRTTLTGFLSSTFQRTGLQSCGESRE